MAKALTTDTFRRPSGPGARAVRREDPADLLRRAQADLAAGRLVEAKEEVENLLDQTPQDDRALNLLAMTYFKLEQYSKAIDLFQRLIERNPKASPLYSNLGLAHLKLEDYEMAVEVFERAIEMDPGNPAHHNYLGLALSKIGEYARAREEFALGNAPKMVEKMEALLEGRGEAAAGATEERTEEEREVSEDVTAEIEARGPEESALPEEAPPEAAEAALPEEETPVPEPLRLPRAKPPRPSPLPMVAAPPAPSRVEPPAAVSLRETPVAPLPLPRTPLPLRPAGPVSLKDFCAKAEPHPSESETFRILDDGLLQVSCNGGRVYLRTANVVASQGDLRFEPELKRFKGKETKAVFGSPEDPILRVVGTGQVLLAPKQWSLSLFTLDEQVVYLSEASILGFDSGLSWENGRIQAGEGQDLNLVQFRGKGTVVVRTTAKPVALSVLPTRSLVADLGSVLGWTGKLVPLVRPLDRPGESGTNGHDGARKGRRFVIEFKGEGAALIEGGSLGGRPAGRPEPLPSGETPGS